MIVRDARENGSSVWARCFSCDIVLNGVHHGFISL